VRRVLLMGAVAAFGWATAVNAATTIVPATANIFQAGQSTPYPTNDNFSSFPFTNYNPAVGGLGEGSLPPSISVFGGETLDLSATGTVSCCVGGSPSNGPEGGGVGGSTDITPYVATWHVGAFTSPTQLALLGVFGGPTLTTPWSAFTIGASRSVVVPTGATTLYFGLADADNFRAPSGWYNDNTGAFTVTDVPETSTWAMMALGFAGLGYAAFRRGVKGRLTGAAI
jgi:hypothetical protein